jgi:hypothetical protein
MLKEIEEAVVARLNEKIASPKNVRIDEAHSDLTLKMPGIDVIISGGAFSRLAQKYELTCSVFVIVTFQNLKSVKGRRHGVYPILEAVIACLVLQKFGLSIDAFVPKRLDNITDEKEAGEGRAVFQLEFETGWTIEKMTDEDVNDLVTIGLNYYLTPGDEDVDATDIIRVDAGS